MHVLHLSHQKLQYAAVLRRNDFVDDVIAKCVRENPSVSPMESILSHISALPDKFEALLQDCKEQLPDIKEEAIRERFNMVRRKYDVVTYPPFPMSLLTDHYDGEAYAKCGVTRGIAVSPCQRLESLLALVKSYHTQLSDSLLDRIFTPITSVYITLFHNDDDCSPSSVPSPTDFELLASFIKRTYDLVDAGNKDPYFDFTHGKYCPSCEAVEERWVSFRARNMQHSESVRRLEEAYCKLHASEGARHERADPNAPAVLPVAAFGADTVLAAASFPVVLLHVGLPFPLSFAASPWSSCARCLMSASRCSSCSV